MPESLASQYTHIGVSLMDLTNPQKFGRVIYKVMRVVTTCVWFYFLPFLAILGSYYLPYLIQTSQK